jgi:hypothetical protein
MIILYISKSFSVVSAVRVRLKDTDSEYVIFIAILRKNSYANAPLWLRIMSLVVLARLARCVCLCSLISVFMQRKSNGS